MPTTASDKTDFRAQVAKELRQIRPAVQSDGGDIELIDVTDEGIVKVRLHGACVGCPSSGMTLKEGVERTLRNKIPQVKEVICV
jgi:Fe-S cluster biogenesis protein NfuA